MTKPAKQNEGPGYAEAAGELDEILQDIESGTVDIDTLSKKVERAAQLIRVCRERLAGTQIRITKVIEELEATEQATDESAADSES